MEGLGIILFVVFIIFSLIEQANKAKQRPGQRMPPRMPPGPYPGAELPPARLPGRTDPDAAAGEPEPGAALDRQGAVQGSAADMVAEDFWRELTGQPPRPRPAPPPPPTTMPAEASSWDEQAVRQVEAPPPETAPRRESKSWDYRRPDVVHEQPVVVSLEEPVQSGDVRRGAFQRKLAAASAASVQDAAKAAASARSVGPRESPLLRRLRRGEGVRESVIMAEIFGRPRGLEEHSPDR